MRHGADDLPWRHGFYLTAKTGPTQISGTPGAQGLQRCVAGLRLHVGKTLDTVRPVPLNRKSEEGIFYMAIDIGISQEDRKSIADGLSRLLADTYVLYLKTHNFHWNVTGPSFRTLHLMFEEQYNELWTAVDMVAERIRTLGYPAPGTYSEFAKLTSIEEVVGVPAATEMITLLVEGHEAVCRTARALLAPADAAADESTADLVTQRLQVHEKTAWMLRSLLA
jgi:starvation-inducible DNA-binding protein